MGKQKQQIISRFFAPKTKTPSSPKSADPSSSSPHFPVPNPNSEPSPSPAKISATVSFSPSKRKLLSDQIASAPKKLKLSPLNQNPTPPQSNPSLHKKFLEKLLEPCSSAPKSVPQIENPKKFTPLEQQVVELKIKHPDVLLMVEVGYRFRFFGEDAEIAAKILGIYAHMDRNFVTASVPTFRLNFHVRRLVSAGYKVGVVKQTETAAIKAHGANKGGPFGRGLSALYTKATLEAAEDVGGKEEECGGESNYLVCVVDKVLSSECIDARIGVVGVEISTGDVIYGQFDDGVMRNGLESVVMNLAPAELLLSNSLSKQTEKLLVAYAGPASNIRIERVSQNIFSDGGALAQVTSLYEQMDGVDVANDEKQQSTGDDKYHSAIEEVMKMPDLAVQALALTIRHLKQFGFERIMCHGASFRSLTSNMEMTLSANALQQLEVLRNDSNGSESGSLFYIMNHTLTTYGSRLLRHWVTHPLCDKNMISARLDAVSEIAEAMGSCKVSPCFAGNDEEDSDVTTIKPEFYSVLSSVLTFLGRSPDIQRGITRIFHRTATPSEFISVMQAILSAGKQLQRLHISEVYESEQVQTSTMQSTLLKKLILTASSSNVLNKAAKFLASLNKEAANQGDLANLFIISDGQFPEVARARAEVKLAKEKLDSLIDLYRKKLGLRKLEFVSVSGTTHLIELPIDVKVPMNWVKVNSTKKMIRYHPPEVVTALDQLTLANEELTVVCRTSWESFLRGFGECYADFKAVIEALAALDCLHSLATLSRNKSYVCPVFVNDDDPVQIQICSGRHPVLETMLQDNFVPNDTKLHTDMENCQIITGPNMGGKSCYLRQVALIALMAQVGSFVPASSATLHVLDGIYTRMGASDSIQQGRSTFFEELSEASQILRSCTSRSLVIIDELGRGTSTHDGVAIAYATLYHLLQQKRSMTLFVTHYPKIADIITEFPGSVAAYHVSFLTLQDNTDSKSDDEEDITYLYKLVPGVSARSFGFKVAQLAQLPSSCIKRAITMAAKMESIENSRMKNKQQKEASTGSENASEELTFVLRNVLLRLNSASIEDDPVLSFHTLKEAINSAKELANW